MFTPGALIPFRVYLSPEKGDYREFFLKYVETDELGIKMSGGLPRLWVVRNGAVFGPMLAFGRERFVIAKLNNRQGLSWLDRCPDRDVEELASG